MKGTQHSLLGLFLLLAACSISITLSCSDSPEGPDDDPALGQVLSLSAELKSAGVHLVWNRLDRAICSNYLLQRSTTPNSGYETIDTIDAFIFACVDKELIADATYYYRIVGLDNANQQFIISNLDTVEITGSCLCLSESTCLISSAGGTGEFVYVLNSANPAVFEWTAAETGDWFSLDATSGISTGGFEATADPNTSDANRTGLVIVTADGIANSPDTVVIAQPARGGILCPSTSAVAVPPLGGRNTEITVASCAGIPSVSWTAESSADWLTVQPPTGISPTGITLTAALNYTGADRYCVVTVCPDGFDEPPDTIVISQSRPFGDPVDYSGAGTLSSICGADFDGDGDIDLAVANSDQSYVSVFRNNGDGTFGAASNQPAGAGTKWIRAADLDGDGDRDLVTVSATGTVIAVHMNAGDATFTVTGLPPLTGLGRITLADCDGDGDVDIISSNRETNRALVLANNGSGAFAVPKLVATGARPEQVSASNINGVGNLDLVTANSVGDNISLLINSSVLTYNNAINFIVQDNPVSICTGDFTGDARPDVAVLCSGTNRVCLMRNTGLTGASRFASSGDLIVPSGPTSICASNLDGDNDIDLVVAASSTSVLVNTGSGLFGTALNLGPGGETLVDVCAEDFDGDGDKDLAVANQTGGVVTVYINNTF